MERSEPAHHLRASLVNIVATEPFLPSHDDLNLSVPFHGALTFNNTTMP
jgi:hypothetical protein